MKSILTIFFAVVAAASFAQDSPAKKKRQPHPSLAVVTDVEGLPRVLLIGDSISMGYTLAVRELLEGKANVHRPLANCGPTTTGLANLDAWLETGGANKKWDVIHFNWGLHDLKYVDAKGQLTDPKTEGSGQQVPLAEYEKNLRALTERLQKTGAKLIWRNTTPVPGGSNGRVAGDAVKYNAVAARIMEEKRITTDDLYTFSKERLAEIQLPANVHFTPEGSKVLGKEVAGAIETALAK